ncbi:hypothetical protein BJ912DRAFT_977232 [Pholiota molesta]|nr:hypothetical protein BJ912DRAFT_977232 [Pholiota molesta]
MLSRIAAARRVPRAFVGPVRTYTTSRTEGSVAQSKEFSKKEKAHEDQFIRKHETEQLAKLKAEIAAKEAEVEALKQKQETIENGKKK